MNEMYSKIAGIQNKLDSNRKLRANIKKIGIVFLFVVFLFSFIGPDTMKETWILTVLLIFLLFFLEVYYIKQNKKYEFELYELEVNELKRKKELSNITGQILSDYELNSEIKVPSNEISLPIMYYLILLILDVMIRVLMIY